ncbi:MAG: NADH:ubiquinone oxidoreductase [Deltaproteobacteria bacterium]|nr:NADH:ubiquinone oxidoreductase [Deltaproteobacteria bacterium]
MTTTLYWLQGGGCGGDTWALMNVESPHVSELLALLGLEVLWHPTLSNGNPAQYRELMAGIIAGVQPLDVLVVEGAIIRGPGGTGIYDSLDGQPKKDLVSKLSKQARFVIAAGTCASFGGIGANGEIEATGLQFHKEQRGGFLGAKFNSRSGYPVINLPGCPCTGDVISGTLTALLSGIPLPLNEFNAPRQWYDLLVHQGCIRNEYHEYRIEEADFGKRGCLFFHMGCRGPLAHGPCNKMLWNRRNSKTRAGVPCVGCTQPDFPHSFPFFQTRNIADIPLELPEGVDRAHYLAYKGMAAAAAPDRLKKRAIRV